MASSGQPAAEDGAVAWQQPVALGWPGPGQGVAKDGAWRRSRGRKRHCARRSHGWSLEAEGEAPATGSGDNCSRWGGWQRTSCGGFLLSAGDGGAAGMGGAMGGDGSGGTPEWVVAWPIGTNDCTAP
jgi:hypothetical protein